MIVNTWFADEERSTVTGCLTLAGAVGHCTCFGMCAYLLNQDMDMIEFLWKIMCFQNIVFLIAVLSIVFLFREKPEHPPSPVSEAKIQPLNLFETFTVVKDNASFRYLLIAFGLKQGTMNTFGLLISDIFTPFGYPAGLLALYGMVFFFSGIAGTIVFAIIADRTLKLKAILFTLAITVGAQLALIACFAADVISTRLLIALALSTFFGVPFLPQSFNMAAELTFPMQPAVITGGMVLTLQIMVSLMTLIYNFIL
jgi:MFS family permease